MSKDSLLTRRRLLHYGAIGTGAAAALTVLPRPLTAMFGGPRPEPIPPIQDDRIKALVQRALDAATAAGATYADVRMTHTRIDGFNAGHANPSYQNEALHVGVRALVSGYWGFAMSPLWSPEELTRLGTAAARQARENLLGKQRDVLLPPVPVVHDGHWETPVKLDPFKIHPDEIGDHLAGMSQKIYALVSSFNRYGDPPPNLFIMTGYTAMLQSKAFGSTDGSYCTQRLIRSDGAAGVRSGAGMMGIGGSDSEAINGDAGDLLTPVAAGWEMYRNSPVLETVHESILRNQALARLPEKPVEVGRYTTILDAKSVAQLLTRTIGAATQLDRILGYESNAGGTSYFMDPETMLGSYAVGPSELTVMGNRSEVGGIATVQWDDEGVAPITFPLIQNGVVAEFLTSREGAGWLKTRTDQLQGPFRSLGCAYSETAIDPPTIHTPNLVMQPSATGGTLQDLEAGVEDGIVIEGLSPQMDFQLLNGHSSAFSCYELRNGQRVAQIRGAGTLFRTPEIWKSMVALGGMKSAQRFGLSSQKGQPSVESYQSVTAVPMKLKDLTLVDTTRR